MHIIKKSIGIVIFTMIGYSSAFGQMAPSPAVDPLVIAGDVRIINISELPSEAQKLSRSRKTKHGDTKNEYIYIDQSEHDTFYKLTENLPQDYFYGQSKKMLFKPGNLPSIWGGLTQVGSTIDTEENGNSVWKLSRIFVTQNNTVIRLHEIDLSGIDRGVAFESENVNYIVHGNPAILKKLTSPKEEIITSLTWVHEKKLNTLEIGGNLRLEEIKKLIQTIERM